MYHAKDRKTECPPGISEQKPCLIYLKNCRDISRQFRIEQHDDAIGQRAEAFSERKITCGRATRHAGSRAHGDIDGFPHDIGGQCTYSILIGTDGT